MNDEALVRNVRNLLDILPCNAALRLHRGLNNQDIGLAPNQELFPRAVELPTNREDTADGQNRQHRKRQDSWCRVGASASQVPRYADNYPTRLEMDPTISKETSRRRLGSVAGSRRYSVTASEYHRGRRNKPLLRSASSA